MQAQLDELDGGRLALQKYMDELLPTLNEHLNTLARERPTDPLQALAALLTGGGSTAAASGAAAAPASAAAASLSVAAADEDWKKKEAEELKAKQAAEAKKAAEKLKAEEQAAAKAAALEAAGKKVAGGLHKFDASEVDVNGGSATADDFMDAFGF